jgi:hypothetical protein
MNWKLLLLSIVLLFSYKSFVMAQNMEPKLFLPNPSCGNSGKAIVTKVVSRNTIVVKLGLTSPDKLI